MKYKFKDEKGAHLHTLGDKPLIGTSTVVGIISKPLTWWASGLAVSRLGWTNPKITDPETAKSALQMGWERVQGISLEDYEKLLTEAYKAHSVKLTDSAEAGTDMHALLEQYVKQSIEKNGGLPMEYSSELDPKVAEFARWAKENVKKFLLSEAHVYSETMWTGGIFDLMYESQANKIMIGDFKSSREAYLSHFIQIAGYDLQFQENGAVDNSGDKLKEATEIDGYVVFPFGSKKFEPTFRFNTKELQEGFKSALTLYKLSNQ